jgi:hypothetical protein
MPLIGKVALVAACVTIPGAALAALVATAVMSVPSDDGILKTNLALSDDANDEIVLLELQKRGSDLSKPTDIVFYLYIPSLRNARSSVRELDRDGLSAHYEQPLGRLSDGSFERRYSVVAHARATPTIEHIRAYRTIFKSLARRFSGEYDGWEAAVST